MNAFPTSMIAVPRLSIDLNGEQVVIGPFTLKELQAILDNAADAALVVAAFTSHIEQPTDHAERGQAFAAAVLKAWDEARQSPRVDRTAKSQLI